MKSKRKKIIDKKFQLKITFKVIGISSILFLCIFAGVALTTQMKISTSEKTIVKLNKAINELNKTIKTEDDIVNGFIKYANYQKQFAGGSRMLIKVDQIQKDHKESMKNIKTSMTFLDSFFKNLKGFFQEIKLSITILIALILIQGIFLYFYLVNMTHRISGPIYVITQHMKDLMEGRKPNLRDLRKNDELKSFYKTFVNFAKSIDLNNKTKKDKKTTSN